MVNSGIVPIAESMIKPITVKTNTLIAISGPRPRESLEPVSATFFFGTSFLVRDFMLLGASRRL
jgi:hypothetical protein